MDMWKSLLVTGLILGLSATACRTEERLEPAADSALTAETTVSAEVAVPANLDRLDPLIIGLIERHVATARRRPADADAHGELALVYEANNLWPEAAASLENATRLAPDEKNWHFHLALARWETGDFERALELLEALTRRHPNFAPGWQRLGDAFLESGRLAEARHAFERLIALEGAKPHGHVGLGDVLLRQGEVPDAALALERAVQLAPDYRAAHYLLGTAYRRLRRLEEAGRELELGAGGVLVPLPDPLSTRVRDYAMGLTARLNRANELLSANRPERAADLLEQVRRAHPENVTVLNNLAIAYLRLGRLDDAKTRLDEALKQSDAKFSTYLNLTSWALRSRQVEQALTYADAAVARAPEMPQTHYSRAQVLANLNRFDDALTSLARNLKIDGGNPSAETFSGDLCLQLRRHAKAVVHFENATRLEPNFLPAWIGLTRAHAGLGETDASHLALARRALEKARDIAPNHPNVRRLADELSKGE